MSGIVGTVEEVGLTLSGHMGQMTEQGLHHVPAYIVLHTVSGIVGHDPRWCLLSVSNSA